jgi:hypothetical protein
MHLHHGVSDLVIHTACAFDCRFGMIAALQMHIARQDAWRSSWMQQAPSTKYQR